MTTEGNKLEKPTTASAGKLDWKIFTVGFLLIGLLIGGVVLGVRHKRPTRALNASPGQGQRDDKVVYSSAKEAASNDSSSGAVNEQQALQQKAAGVKAAELQAAQQAQEAADQQRAAQEAVLAEKQRELEQMTAAQQAKEQQLEQERQRVEAEKQKAQEAAAEAQRLKEQAAAAAVVQQRPSYSGPSSGTIVWQGEVKGTTLVTINGSASDVGQVVSGALPGVLVMLQPVDSKHVGVAASPSPSNSYERLTLRVQGNGMLQESIRWSIP